MRKNVTKCIKMYKNVTKCEKCNVNFTIFADDTTILWHDTDVNNEQGIAADLNTIKEWCDANLLSFNVKKTNILNFKCDLNSVSLNDQIISRLNVYTFLGLSIDRSLRFEDHIFKLCKRVSSGCCE